MPSDDQGPYVVIAPMRIDTSAVAGAGALPGDDLIWRVLDILRDRLSGCRGFQAHPVPGGLVLGLLLDDDRKPLSALVTTVYAVLSTGLGIEVGVTPIDGDEYVAAASENSQAVYAVRAAHSGAG
jgi:hypothetical protein